MSEREELAKALFALDVSNGAAETAPEIAALCEKAADALLAAGWTNKLPECCTPCGACDDCLEGAPK